MKVRISQKGAILLGDQISCDGFVDNKGYRVQTHVHEDHLRSFNTSLGYQKGIFLTRPTRDLIATVKNNPALHSRNNVHVIEVGVSKQIDGFEIEFLDSSHMLGAVQVAVDYDGGPRLGYSGDFSWPLDKIIQVEVLVLDSTYGAPESIRGFSQSTIEERLLELVSEYLTKNPVIVSSHRGTIQRAMHCINSNINVPLIVSKRLLKEIRIFNQYGYGLTNYYTPLSEEGQEVLESQRYVRFYGTGDILPCDISGLTAISLGAVFGRLPDPVLDLGNNAFKLAYSTHADFAETVEYVRATNAKKVFTDPTRASFESASSLASEIKRRLNIEAEPCRPIVSNYWGE